MSLGLGAFVPGRKAGHGATRFESQNGRIPAIVAIPIGREAVIHPPAVLHNIGNILHGLRITIRIGEPLECVESIVVKSPADSLVDCIVRNP